MFRWEITEVLLCFCVWYFLTLILTIAAVTQSPELFHWKPMALTMCLFYFNKTFLMGQLVDEWLAAGIKCYSLIVWACETHFDLYTVWIQVCCVSANASDYLILIHKADIWHLLCKLHHNKTVQILKLTDRWPSRTVVCSNWCQFR